MKFIRSTIFLGLGLLTGNPVMGIDSDANDAAPADSCPALVTDSSPRFSVSHVRAVLTIPTDSGDDEWGCEASIKGSFVYPIAHYFHTSDTNGVHNYDPPPESQNWDDVVNVAFNLRVECALYNGSDSVGSGQSTGLAELINMCLTNSPGADNYSLVEDHDDSSFSVTLKSYDDEGNLTSIWQVDRSWDGAVVPTRNINYGLDQGCDGKPCSGCAAADDSSADNDGSEDYGMPRWNISEPYLNLWLHDTPVFYRTSLGKKVGFKVNFKSQDTRPLNDGMYPTTGWNHNWYSYIRYNVPIYASLTSGTNTSIAYFTARGVGVRANWITTNDYTHWQAILYAPDNSESYFTHDPTDPAGLAGVVGSDGRDGATGDSLIPMYASGSITGFRLLHPDGSQDIYSYILGPTNTFGITKSFGAVYDRRTLHTGIEAVTDPTGLSCGASRRTWQDGGDAAIYETSDEVTNVLGQSELITGFGPPSGAIEYLAYDALLTRRIDPYGNAILLSYETNSSGCRLAGLTDYDNKTTSITYDTNGNLALVSMPYDRTAQFVHDAAGNLRSIVDAAGMASSMTYTQALCGTNRQVVTLTTPYGTTHFAYYEENPYKQVRRSNYYSYDADSGTEPLISNTNTIDIFVGRANCTHTIAVTHPDNTKEYYAYSSSNSIPLTGFSAPSTALQTAAGGHLDLGVGEGEAALAFRNCFHWGRDQSALISGITSLSLLTASNFAVAAMSHYLAEAPITGSANQDVSQYPSWEREPSPDGTHAGKLTWITYDTTSEGWQSSGAPSVVSQFTEAPDGTPLVNTVSYDSKGRLSSISDTYTKEDGTAGSRNISYDYWEIDVDDGVSPHYTLSALQAINGPDGHWLMLRGEPDTTVVDGVPVLSESAVDVWDAENHQSTFHYNSRHQPTSAHLANGLDLQWVYDGSGYLQKTIAVQSHTTNSFVITDGEVASQTTPLGLTVTHSYDLLGRLTGTVFPDGTSISNIFDKLDVVARKDRLGNWSHASYDNMGRLRELTSPKSEITLFDYCNCGGLATETDPLGHTTTYNRDNLGRVTNIVTAAGTTSLERDSLGRVTHVTSTDGEDVHYGYNLQGLVTSEANAAGGLYALGYDINDRVEWATNATGVVIQNEYDLLGRLLERWIGARQRVDYNVYSARGLERHYDALNKITDYGYDDAGRLIAVTNANLEVTQVGLDPVGNMLSLTDGRNHTRHWTYNVYGQRITATDANGVLVRTNAYDPNGRLTNQWTAAKGTKRFGYDDDGNLTSVVYPTMATALYGYDALGRMVTYSNALGSSTMTYENFGAGSGALASEGGLWSGDTVSHGHSGRVFTSVNVGSWSQSIARDSALRPSAITSPAGTFTYGYNGAGMQLASLQMPGSTNLYSYDELGRLSGIQLKKSGGTVLESFTYLRDLAGQITNVTRLHGNTVGYGYDNIGQLISAEGQESGGLPRLNESLGYGYDAAGNLLSRTNATLIQAFTSDDADRLLNVSRSGMLTVIGSVTGAVATLGVNGRGAALYSDGTFATTNGLVLEDGTNLFVTAGSNGAGALVASTINKTYLPASFNLTYALNGNLLSDGLRTFTYDDADELESVYVASQWKTEFAYDALGRRRIAKDYAWGGSGWTQTNETRYVYDGMTVLQERDSANAVKVTYSRGLDLSGSFGGAGGIGGLLARTDGSGSVFYHGDAGGNITALTDASGNVVGRYLYDPFGAVLGKWGGMADVNAMQFSSMPRHAQSGLSLYAFREYDAGLQRWTQRDPLGERGEANPYGFVGNSSPGFVDPYGLSLMSTVGMITDPGGMLLGRLNNWLGDKGDQALKGLYGAMMGPEPGQYDPNTYGRMRADLIGGIDRNDNVLRDVMGDSGRLAAKTLANIAESMLLERLGNLPGRRRCRAVAAKPAVPEIGFVQHRFGGRRGNPKTRDFLEQIRDKFLDANPEYRHVAGGRDRVTGAEIPEEYIPGPGGGRWGSSFPDLTFEGLNGGRIRINSTDTLVDGSMTSREQGNFDRIFDQTGEPIISVPKPR